MHARILSSSSVHLESSLRAIASRPSSPSSLLTTSWRKYSNQDSAHSFADAKVINLAWITTAIRNLYLTSTDTKLPKASNCEKPFSSAAIKPSPKPEEPHAKSINRPPNSFSNTSGQKLLKPTHSWKNSRTTMIWCTWTIYNYSRNLMSHSLNSWPAPGLRISTREPKTSSRNTRWISKA